MRARLARDLPARGPWDVKHRAGRQIEVEFIAQTLQLVHARGHPDVPHPTTRVALAAAARGRAAGGGRRGAADPRRPHLAHGAGHAAASPRGGRRASSSPPPRPMRCCAPRPSAGIAAVDLAGLRATLDALARRRARGLRAPCGGDRDMSLKRRRRGAGFRDAGERRADRQPRVAARASRSCCISIPRPTRPAAPRKPAPSRRRCRSLASIGIEVIGVSTDKMQADREVRREIRAEIPARLRRRDAGRRGVRRVGREVDVRPQIHGHGTQHVPDRPRGQDRAHLAEGEGRRATRRR